MPSSWYARRELELALLVVSIALVAYGASAATPVNAPHPIASEPLDAWAPIAARDLFNGARDAVPADGSRRLVGVGFQGGEARAAIEDTRTHRQELLKT